MFSRDFAAVRQSLLLLLLMLVLQFCVNVSVQGKEALITTVCLPDCLSVCVVDCVVVCCCAADNADNFFLLCCCCCCCFQFFQCSPVRAVVQQSVNEKEKEAEIISEVVVVVVMVAVQHQQQRLFGKNYIKEHFKYLGNLAETESSRWYKGVQKF